MLYAGDSLGVLAPGERLNGRAFIKNATNEEVLGGVLGFGGARRSFQPPRTYGVELSAAF